MGQRCCVPGQGAGLPLAPLPNAMHASSAVFPCLLPLPSLLQVLPEMLRSAMLAAQKGMGPDEAYVRNMLGFVWGPLVEVIPKVG